MFTTHCVDSFLGKPGAKTTTNWPPRLLHEAHVVSFPGGRHLAPPGAHTPVPTRSRKNDLNKGWTGMKNCFRRQSWDGLLCLGIHESKIDFAPHHPAGGQRTRFCPRLGLRCWAKPFLVLDSAAHTLFKALWIVWAGASDPSARFRVITTLVPPKAISEQLQTCWGSRIIMRAGGA